MLKEIRLSLMQKYIISFFLIIAMFDLWWIFKDHHMFTWDQAYHMMSSIRYERLLSSFNFSELSMVDWYYPPFFKMVSAFLYIIFGFSEDIALATNIIFIGILLGSIYGIGSKMHSQKAGVLAAVLVISYPIIFNQHLDYLLDVSLTAMIVLSFYLLLLSNNFSNYKYSILFGVVAGLSFLTKWTAFEYIGVFVGYTFLKILLTKFNFDDIKNKKPKLRQKAIEEFKDNKNRQITVLFFVLIISFIFSAWWYIPNGEKAFSWIKLMSPKWAAAGGDEVSIIGSLIFYLSNIPNMITLPLTGAFIVALFFLKRDYSKYYGLALWILLPLIIMVFVADKAVRFIMPILPAIALITAIGFMVNKKLMYILAVIGVATIIFNMSQIVPVPEQDWKMNEIMDTIKDNINKNPSYIVFVSDNPFYNFRTIEYQAVQRNIPVYGIGGWDIGLEGLKQNINNFNFVIYIENKNSEQMEVLNNEKEFVLKSNKFVLLRKIDNLPDNSSIFILKNAPIRGVI